MLQVTKSMVFGLFCIQTANLCNKNYFFCLRTVYLKFPICGNHNSVSFSPTRSSSHSVPILQLNGEIRNHTIADRRITYRSTAILLVKSTYTRCSLKLSMHDTTGGTTD